jgi:hypothetical protein
MKVAIFETEHFEACYPVIKLFDDGKNEITVFCYQEAYEQFKYLFPGEPSKYTWVVKPAKKSKYRFIIDMYRLIKKNKISLLYLNTISNNFIFYAVLVYALRNTRVILTIHNIKTQFEFKPSLSPRRIARFIGRRQLLRAVTEFNVIAMTMMSSLAARLPSHRKVYCIPGGIFEEDKMRQLQPPIHDKIKIVIPGSVDGRRRNYEQALELIIGLEEAKLVCTMIFLGPLYGAYGGEILNKSRQLELNYATLKYFGSETIPQPEFDRHMSEATFVYIPSALTPTIEDGVMERYGETMSSGSLFDAVKYAKPCLIPKALPVDPPMEDSCFRYDKVEDIIAFLLALRAGPKHYDALLQKALTASREYTIQKIKARNPGLFKN